MRFDLPSDLYSHQKAFYGSLVLDHCSKSWNHRITALQKSVCKSERSGLAHTILQKESFFFLFDSLNCVVFVQPSTLLRCHSLTLFSGSSLTVDLFWFFPHSFSLPLSLWFVSLLRLLCLRLNALSFVLPLSSGSKVCYTMMCFVVKEKG